MKKMIVGVLLAIGMFASTAQAEVFQCETQAKPVDITQLHSGLRSEAADPQTVVTTVVEAYDRTVMTVAGSDNTLNFPAMQQVGNNYATASGKMLLARWSYNGQFGYSLVVASTDAVEATQKDIVSLLYIMDCKAIGTIV